MKNFIESMQRYASERCERGHISGKEAKQSWSRSQSAYLVIIFIGLLPLLECEIIYPRPLLNVLLQFVPVPRQLNLCSVIYGNVVRCL